MRALLSVIFLILAIIILLVNNLRSSWFDWGILVRRINFCPRIVLDTMSCTGSFLVLFIRRCVFIFTYYYFPAGAISNRFVMLLALFVLSMLILLISGRVPSLLIGWDGLGVVSFLLILFYDSLSTKRSRMITYSINRLGDGLWLRFIMVWLARGQLHSIIGRRGFVLIIVIVAITKRAQFPFRSWLPLAMDAPTPVSALVHSSTLVTAGFFLLCRIQGDSINYVLILLGSMTLVVGGWSSLFRSDLKKLIAHSTLSNLGLIAVCLGAGNKIIILAQLGAHGLYKAGVFLMAGLVLMASLGVQDGRSTRKVKTSVFYSMLVILVTSSCGVLFITTFNTKHVILLLIQRRLFSLPMLLALTLGVLLTIGYSFRLIYVIRFPNYTLSISSPLIIGVFLTVLPLAVISLLIGHFYSVTSITNSYYFDVDSAVILLLTAGSTLLFLSYTSKLSPRVFLLDGSLDWFSSKSSRFSNSFRVDIGWLAVKDPRSRFNPLYWSNNPLEGITNSQIVVSHLCLVFIIYFVLF